LSRRDYIATAAILREADLSIEQRADLADRFAVVFAQDNPRFSRRRFLEAVGPTLPNDRGDGVCLTCGWGAVLHCAGACPVAVNGQPTPAA
jgi:transcriptional regulator CtsR